MSYNGFALVRQGGEWQAWHRSARRRPIRQAFLLPVGLEGMSGVADAIIPASAQRIEDLFNLLDEVREGELVVMGVDDSRLPSPALAMQAA